MSLNNRKLNKTLAKNLAGGVHYNFRFPWEKAPLHFVSGKGLRLKDVDGNEYLDFYAKFGAMILGHNNNEFTEYLVNFIETSLLAIDHGQLDASVSAKIIQHVPSAEKIRFSLSGSEAVQNALRLARAYTKKNKFIRFLGHYHGNMDNILGGTILDIQQPVPVEYNKDYRGTAGRAKGILESQSYMIPWNNTEIIENLLNQHADDIAAIIMEPISVNGGGIMPRMEYLASVQKLSKKFNVIIIFDEVITGFRVGLGGAQELFNVMPDITILGKAISGGGVPVSCITGKKNIMDLYTNRTVVQGGTFNGYPLGMAAVNATLNILEKEGRYLRMDSTMKQIMAILENEAKKIGFDLVIQGPPSCFHIHCRTAILDDTSQWDITVQNKEQILREVLLAEGILVAPLCRFYSNIMITDDDVTLFEKKIRNAFPIAMKKIEAIK